MREVAVAFPGDEPSAEVIASRLRAARIPARVDRGLFGSGYQVPLARGHLTVLVKAGDAARAHDVLGTRPAEGREPGLMFWGLLGFVVLALIFSVGAVIATALR